MIVSGLMVDVSGLVSLSGPKVPSRLHRFEVNGFKRVQLVSHQISGLRVLNSSLAQNNQIKCNVSSGKNHQDLSFQDDFRSDPYWLTLIKEFIWGLRSLVVFLVEQPSQLRYIEWPGFQSTLKTAILTLVLVALLIVALSSVDSILCFLLALLLRKTA